MLQTIPYIDDIQALLFATFISGDLNCLVAATSRSGCFIWDFEKERIIMRFNEHGKSSVYTVSWNQRDSKYIASVGSDSNWLALSPVYFKVTFWFSLLLRCPQ